MARWHFHDPNTGENYEPPIGPDRMTSPLPVRAVDAVSTTSRQGTIVVWEGAPEPAQWAFSGRLLSQVHYEALQAWYAKPNRVIISDHLARQWVCYITDFDAEPQRALHLPWSHRYTMRATVFARYA